VTDAPPTNSKEYAKELDRSDPLNSLRLEFQIPQKDDSKEPVSYLAGSAIGLQPKCVLTRIRSFVDQWAKQGLLAGFTPGTGENCPSWIEAEDVAAKLLEPIVGAIESEVTLMNSLTTNLHLLLASFYQPNKEGNMRTRIIVEEAAFSSDWVSLRGVDVDERNSHSISTPSTPRSRGTGSTL
jgi:kynureninase